MLFSNKNGKDYYKNGITVSCVFTLPEPSLHYNSTVTYANGGNININNKYYTINIFKMQLFLE